MSDPVTPAPISIPEAQLADLRRRLEGVRWPDRETVGDGSQGPQLHRVRALVEHWRDRYDWRRCEAELNGLGPSRTTLDGLGIHFLHVRSPEPDALPLLLTHGWPGSVLEFRDAVGPLTDPAAHGGRRSDAFHLVIPSLPGFGFSDQPSGSGWGVPRIAAAWIALMGRLGYGGRWGAQGGDWGAAVTTAIGHRAPPGCVGVHLNFALFRPTPEEVAEATPAERAMLDGMRRYEQTLSGYAKVQGTRPQSVGYALADSPAGLLAWIYALFQDASGGGGEAERALTPDQMLDDVMLYWLPNAGASSARLYWEAMSSAPEMGASPMPVPAGVSMFPGEIVRLSRRWAERRFARLVHFGEPPRGGHFAAMEQPALFVDEVRATFAALRA